MRVPRGLGRGPSRPLPHPDARWDGRLGHPALWSPNSPPPRLYPAPRCLATSPCGEGTALFGQGPQRDWPRFQWPPTGPSTRREDSSPFTSCRPRMEL